MTTILTAAGYLAGIIAVSLGSFWMMLWLDEQL